MNIISYLISLVVFLFSVNSLWLGNVPTWLGIISIIVAWCIFAYSIFVLSERWHKRGFVGKIRRAGSYLVFSVLLILGTGMMLLTGNLFGIGEAMPVADIERKIEIWGLHTAGNHPGSKLDDMNIKGKPSKLISNIRFANGIVGTKYKDSEAVIDTFTYLHEIVGGYELDTYEDEPYLIPYLVSDSDHAVIVIPGGGYSHKSMDGETAESKDIATTLNEAGISAFVLHYRSNPYEWPIPQLDLQRAIRYLRYHGEALGINSDKISLLGFSAGGYQAGSFINLVQGKDLFPEDYQPDHIDQVDDFVSMAAMIYPALTYNYNVPMLFASFDAKEVRDEKRRAELLNQTDLLQHFSSEDVSQFICYGTSDRMVDMAGTIEYIQAASLAGADIVDIVAVGQDHGFGQAFYMEEYIQWLKSK